MHEIRATVPLEQVAETARLAHEAGIDRVSIADIYVDGPNVRRQVVSVETSTPKARLFVETLLSSPVLAATDYTLTSRELRAIVDRTNLPELTDPISEPFPDVIQDLWQLSHLTASYLARALAGGILLAIGIVENNAVAVVVAALFIPFLSEVLAVSCGVWSRDSRLILRGLRALAASTSLTFAGGLIVAACTAGPIRYDAFQSPLRGFVLSAIIGIAAGLSIADDTGRRYLIGVAAAVQLAIFPAWFGAAAILGIPSNEAVARHILSFAINLMTICATALLSYAILHLRTGSRTLAK